MYSNSWHSSMTNCIATHTPSQPISSLPYYYPARPVAVPFQLMRGICDRDGSRMAVESAEQQYIRIMAVESSNRMAVQAGRHSRVAVESE